jgi:hypothetical protein
MVVKHSKSEATIGDKTFLYINLHGFKNKAHRDEIYNVISKALKIHDANIKDFDTIYEADF